MNRKLIYVLTLVLVLALFIIIQPVSASEAEEDPFEEIYVQWDDYTPTYHNIYSSRLKLIDKNNHIYLSTPRVVKPGSIKGINYVDGSLFDRIPNKNQNQRVSLTGILSDSEAAISNASIWEYPDNNYQLDNTKAYCLPENVVIEDGYDDNGISTNEIYYFTKSRSNSINPFTITFETNNTRFSYGPDIYQIEITAENRVINCIIIVQKLQIIDYFSFDENGHWIKSIYDNGIWNDIKDSITLYEGAGAKTNCLQDEYQFGWEIDWRSGKFISGLTVEDKLKETSSICLPSNLSSIRIRYDNNIPDSTMAVFPDMPGGISKITEKEQRVHDYYYYKNKTRLLCVNGNLTYEIKEGELSPEIKLKKGINVLLISGGDTSQFNTSDLQNIYQLNMPNSVILLYWDGDEEYEISNNNDSELKYFEIYQGTLNEEEAIDHFERLEIIQEGDNNYINLNSAYPHVWIHPVSKDPAASITIDDSIKYIGGFWKRLDPDKDSFDITVTSADYSESKNYRIGIKWTLNGAELKSLNLEAGGTLDQSYDPDVFTYHCERNLLGKTIFSFETIENTVTEIYLDRVKTNTITNSCSKSLSVSPTTKEVQWRITGNTGKTVTYIVYFNRDREEKGISGDTQQRAAQMIKKMVDGGFLDYLKNGEAVDYWKTFGAASLGMPYLDGMLGYDVTKKEFRQSTDYSSVILELIMSGENPYNYLGTDYVQGLLDFDVDGNFGGFSANIWAVAALSAAGSPVPDETIQIVKSQALSEKFDLDMRGWSLYALNPFKNIFTDKEYSFCIQSLKNKEIQIPMEMNGINVTGCFENDFYTNRNIMSHACVVSGLVAMGIDPANGEFNGDDGSDPVSILERYQLDSGIWFYSPENTMGGNYNKDVVVAVGDLYNGSSVYTRYYLTEHKYSQLVSKARQMLEDSFLESSKREALQKAYDEASKYVSSGSTISTHGEAYYTLQDAMIAVDESISPGVFLGTAEEREQVNEVKQDIERISSYSYKDKKDLDQIKEKYDAIKEERLYHYIRNSDVLDKAYSYIKDIDDFLGSVDKIGSVNLTKTTKIKKARKAYDALSESQKTEAVVKKGLKTLLDAEAAIIKMNKPDKVERAIRNLGSIVTLDMQDDIQAVREAYDSLPNADKAKVGNVKDLERAEEKLSYLLVQEAAIDNAAIVTEKISSIGDVSRNSEEAICQAREAYDTLETEEEKNLVSNYRILLDSETEYANLLNRENLGNALTEADYYINQIYDAFGDSDQLGENNYTNVSVAVETARQFFELEKGKRSDFCEMVSGYPSYVDIRTMLMEYSFDPDQDVSLSNLEETLDSIGDVTLDHEPVVRKAEMIVEALTASDETFEDFESYESRISSLREEITMIRDNYPDICSFVTAVGSIGEVNQTFQDAYLEAADLYNNADDALISRIPSCTIETIKEASDKYGEIQEELKELDRVEKLIDKTRQISSLMDEELVVSARDAYDGSERKESISNYLTLVESDRKIDSLKKKVEDAQIAAEVEDMIGLLDNSSGINSVDVALARVAYDALTDAQKKMVSNYIDLMLAEKMTEITDSKDDSTGSTEPANKLVFTMSLIRNKKASKPYLIGKKTKYTLVLKINGKEVKNSKIKWRSSKKSIATVSKGVLTVKKKGKVKIIAAYSGKNYTRTFTVEKAIFKLRKKRISLKKGEKYQIKYMAVPKSSVIFKSMSKKVAVVSKKGIIKAKHRGNAVITISCNGIRRYLKITVY